MTSDDPLWCSSWLKRRAKSHQARRRATTTRNMQHEHEEWELVSANEVHVVEALKQQGNQLFQQQRYLDAIQVYSQALEKLPDVDNGVVKFMREDVEAFENLEIGVRLNRALAYIELEDDKLLWYAEKDCSAALSKRNDCVKAWYRRSLARERMGELKGALSDAGQMYALEPANPAAHQLIARLQEAWSSMNTSKTRATALSAAMQECTLSEKPHPSSLTNQELSAEAVWKALQDEEQQVRKVFRRPSSTKSARKPAAKNPAPKPKKAAPEYRTVDRVISNKTESLWEALTQEEAVTVSKVYKRATSADIQHPHSSKIIKTASIHPGR